MKSKKSLLRGGGVFATLAILAVPIFAMSASAGLQENGGFSVRAHTQHGEKTLEHTVSGFGSGGGSPVDPGGEVDDSEFITMASAGEGFTLALARDETVYSFGSNSDGELGLGFQDGMKWPTKIPSLKKIKSIESRNSLSAAVDEAGDVYVWGKSDQKSYFNAPGDNATPTKVEGLSNIEQVSIAVTHGFAIDRDGELWSWGSNNYGVLGIGNENLGNDDPLPPIKVGLSNVKQVITDQWSTIALSNDGSVHVFGANYDGIFGAGRENMVLSPYKILDSDKKIFSIGRSDKDFFMVDKDGQVYVIGENHQGQLGFGHQDKITEPTLLTIPPVSKVFPSKYHTLALTEAGELYGFGRKGESWIENDDGSQEIVTPMKLDYADGENILQISSSSAHTVFVMKNGKIKGVGSNASGQLGNITSGQIMGFTEIKLK